MPGLLLTNRKDKLLIFVIGSFIVCVALFFYFRPTKDLLALRPGKSNKEQFADAPSDLNFPVLVYSTFSEDVTDPFSLLDSFAALGYTNIKVEYKLFENKVMEFTKYKTVLLVAVDLSFNKNAADNLKKYVDAGGNLVTMGYWIRDLDPSIIAFNAGGNYVHDVNVVPIGTHPITNNMKLPKTLTIVNRVTILPETTMVVSDSGGTSIISAFTTKSGSRLVHLNVGFENLPDRVSFAGSAVLWASGVL